MKIIENTPDLLIAEDAAWVLASTVSLLIIVALALALALLHSGLFIPGLGLMLIALVLAVSLGVTLERTSVFFDARRDTVSIRRRRAQGTRTVTRPMHQLKGTELDFSGSDDQDRQRVMMRFSGGTAPVKVPITRIYTNSANHRIVTETINAWLEAHRS
jgi:hypothetical protein